MHMPVSGFDRLVAGIASLAGLPLPDLPRDPDATRSLHITIDAVAIRLACMPALRPDCALVFCIFGALPKGRETAALTRLMALNFKLFCGASLRFAIDETSGEVLGCYEINYAESSPERVLEDFEQVVDQAEAWRRTYFLEDHANGAARVGPANADALRFA